MSFFTAYTESEFNKLVTTATDGGNFVVGEPIATKRYGVVYQTKKEGKGPDAKQVRYANVWTRQTDEGGFGRLKATVALGI